ncbi:maleylpyruvate isomerase N-terminal domain-containing protein [Brevibacterium casei]
MPDPVIDAQLDCAERCWVTALGRLGAEAVDRSSGCAGWTNRDLVNHLVGGGLRYAMLLRQEDPAAVEATRAEDHLGEDPLVAFWERERDFRASAGECDLDRDVAHRIGPISGHQLVRMRILELTLHAADLSTGTGHAWPIEESLAEWIESELGDLIVSLGATGGYAPPREASASVTAAERVLLLSGRTP